MGQKKDNEEIRILPLLSTSVQLCLNASAAGVIDFQSRPLAKMMSVSSAVPCKFACFQIGQKSTMPGLASSFRRLHMVLEHM